LIGTSGVAFFGVEVFVRMLKESVVEDN